VGALGFESLKPGNGSRFGFIDQNFFDIFFDGETDDGPLPCSEGVRKFAKQNRF
jgi:hypothetical protein